MPFRSLVLIILIANGCSSEEDAPSVVTTISGKIRGHYLTSYKGNKYEAYQGIPYAEPPVGDKRFQPPEPIKPWSDELNATKMKELCVQNMATVGLEDCLYLNVYVPSTEKNSNESLPVIVWIHGGAFSVGGAKESEETFIIDHDVIFVSVQYRLGVLGFLSTEDEVVPGNMGLKDQSVALRWVHDNIANFGGDPKRIALVGHSSGSACVHFHYLSPWSHGLFHAGLSLSGTAFAPWSIPENSRAKVLELGQSLNCSSNDDVHLVIECLKAQPINLLLQASAVLPSSQTQPQVPFGPVVEKSSSKPFIDDLPRRIVSSGKAYDVPWITGVVSEEGLFPVAMYAYDSAMRTVDKGWYQMAPIMLDFFYAIPREQHNNVSETARKHYYGDKPMTTENVHLLTDLVSDRFFKASTGEAARKQAAASKSPVYLYHYSYRATDSVSNALTNSTQNLGVAHGDDSGLVLKGLFIDPTKSPQDLAMQQRLIQLWTSVARYGEPKMDVDWTKVTPNGTNLEYLQITDPSHLEMKSNDDFGQYKFWKSLKLDEKKM